MAALGCWRFAKFPFDLNVAEVAEQGYRGRVWVPLRPEGAQGLFV